jgi:hypothetical protein
MKKVIKAVCSALCFTAMTLPANVMANPVSEVEDNVDEAAVEQELADDYHLAFVTGDFGLQFAMTDPDQSLGAMVMFISDRRGKIVKNAQVITTVIDQEGQRMMQRARPLKGGYLIDTMHLPSGHYRMEAEIVTGGQLLIDEFVFQKT